MPKSKAKKMVITICSSVSFYPSVIEIQAQLEGMGYKVLIPHTAIIMQQTNNFNREDYSPWLQNPQDYSKKRELIDKHFDKVKEADAVLIVNNEKNSIPGYIGGNVLMEITLAYFLKKPIYILNPLDEKLPVKEEVYSINPIFLHGDITKINQKI
jgi:hypothetical protein